MNTEPSGPAGTEEKIVGLLRRYGPMEKDLLSALTDVAGKKLDTALRRLFQTGRIRRLKGNGSLLSAAGNVPPDGEMISALWIMAELCPGVGFTDDGPVTDPPGLSFLRQGKLFLVYPVPEGKEYRTLRIPACGEDVRIILLVPDPETELHLPEGKCYLATVTFPESGRGRPGVKFFEPAWEKQDVL